MKLEEPSEVAQKLKKNEVLGALKGEVPMLFKNLFCFSCSVTCLEMPIEQFNTLSIHDPELGRTSVVVSPRKGDALRVHGVVPR